MLNFSLRNLKISLSKNHCPDYYPNSSLLALTSTIFTRHSDYTSITQIYNISIFLPSLHPKNLHFIINNHLNSFSPIDLHTTISFKRLLMSTLTFKNSPPHLLLVTLTALAILLHFNLAAHHVRLFSNTTHCTT